MSTKISSKKSIPVVRAARRVTAKNGAINRGNGAIQSLKRRTPLQELLDSIVELGKQIPEEELAKIPRDFAKNVDHYLYGAPKVD
jgi:hypothetical protein